MQIFNGDGFFRRCYSASFLNPTSKASHGGHENSEHNDYKRRTIYSFRFHIYKTNCSKSCQNATCFLSNRPWRHRAQLGYTPITNKDAMMLSIYYLNAKDWPMNGWYIIAWWSYDDVRYIWSSKVLRKHYLVIRKRIPTKQSHYIILAIFRAMLQYKLFLF